MVIETLLKCLWYIICVYMYVFTWIYVHMCANSIDKIVLCSKISYLLSGIYLRPICVDKLRDYSWPCSLPQLCLFAYYFSSPGMSICTVCVLNFSHILSFPHGYWKWSVYSHISKPRSQTVYASFARNINSLVMLPIVRALSSVHVW